MAHAPSLYFPDVTGQSLDGTDYTLPADLSAPLNLLVLSLRGDLEALADQWVRFGQRLAARSDERLAIYELPVVGKRSKLFQGLVNASLAARTDDEANKARTIPLHLKRTDLCERLGLTDSKTVHVLLVHQTGRIIWRGQGLLTPEQIGEAETAFDAALGATASADATNA